MKIKKFTLRAYLFRILALFLFINLAQANNLPSIMGTCMVPKDPASPSNGGRIVTFFVYKDEAFSTFGPANIPSISNSQVRDLFGVNWSIGQTDKFKNLWQIIADHHGISVTGVTCVQDQIRTSNADNQRLAMSSYNYLVRDRKNPNLIDNPIKIQFYECNEGDPDDIELVSPNERTPLVTGKKKCPGCCAIS